MVKLGMFHQNLRGAAEFGEGETTPPLPFPFGTRADGPYIGPSNTHN